MQPIILQHTTENEDRVQAIFLPDRGMNLISLKKGEIEVIDQSTYPLFEERFAGLGSLIGPHFHRRKSEILPTIKDEGLFPHIARIKAKGVQEPFSHGIARYAPWKAESSLNTVKAEISGKDIWNGVPLAELEGQNFNMQLKASLNEMGLHLDLSVVSDTASLVGIHYYYALPGGKGRIVARVQNLAIIEGKLENLPTAYLSKLGELFLFDLNEEADFTLYPYPDRLFGEILLETELYQLRTRYHCDSAENAWQLYHPKGASFVCIEPLSAQDPRHPNLTVSSLNIQIEIITGHEK